MPFREHIMPPISKRRVVKAAKKSGPKPTGVAAVMGQIGKNLTPSERAVLRAPLPPPWQRDHVVDPAWVGTTPSAPPLKEPEAPTTIIGNYEVAALNKLFDENLFALERGGQPGEHHVYKLDDEEQEKVRTHLRDFISAVWLAAGGKLPEDQDEFDLQLDQIETKVGAQLKLLVKGLKEATISQLANEEGTLLDTAMLERSVWQNWIVDGYNHTVRDAAARPAVLHFEPTVTPQECIAFGLDNLDAPELQYLFDDLKRQGIVK